MLLNPTLMPHWIWFSAGFLNTSRWPAAVVPCHPFILQGADKAHKLKLDDSGAAKLELQEAPPAAPASELPPSGAVPPWEREGAPEIGGATAAPFHPLRQSGAWS